MICDYCFQPIKKLTNSIVQKDRRATVVSFCGYECKDAYDKDRIADLKYDKKYRLN
jgi:hypothetical protein